jgi:hypothetical protein
MKTVTVPTFDEFENYSFIKNVEVKIKNKPDWKDVNKITAYLPGIPQGGCGKYPLKDLLTDGKKEVRSFYDRRQKTKVFKDYFVTIE